MNHESRRPVAIEDLLRLKRAERPPAEFWDGFDRQLRAKQLAALVEKRPWWRSLPRLASGFTRWSLPVGATAILAVAFVATRDFSIEPAATGRPEQSVSAANRAGDLVSVAESTAPRVAPSSVAAAVTVAPARIEYVAAAGVPAGRDTAAADASGSFPGGRMEVEEVSPSARHIAANLAAAQAAVPEIARGLLTSPRGFEERLLSTQLTTEPLAQVSTPEERSRARFATAMVASFNGDTRSRVSSANVARRISDDRVYDDVEIRRVGATGNSVAWRF